MTASSLVSGVFFEPAILGSSLGLEIWNVEPGI